MCAFKCVLLLVDFVQTLTDVPFFAPIAHRSGLARDPIARACVVCGLGRGEGATDAGPATDAARSARIFVALRARTPSASVAGPASVSPLAPSYKGVVRVRGAPSSSARRSICSGHPASTLRYGASMDLAEPRGRFVSRGPSRRGSGLTPQVGFACCASCSRRQIPGMQTCRGRWERRRLGGEEKRSFDNWRGRQ